ncbi:methionine aminopeptidase, type I [Synechococcus sp. PCC 7502]|uniref:type I methionyl aminopeptidase n=1 Tax=Synechococcus sp. PCC 7502 TaxID=1173263 RepID=UPI00029FEB20|nr:type I methionyl aminopeptidase [Synechococcus sp. PCC 7502]AFY74807.1 methionine aminopeptidase, type I [Synechococcus sp. PCC 7502]
MNILTTLRSQSKSQPQAEVVTKATKGIEIKSKRELEIMRESSRIVATVLKEISQIIAPGMTTLDLDTYAEKRVREMGAIPSFKGYHKFPATLCVSVNNEVVHGIPNAKKVIKAGDLVKVDVGAFQNGFHGDSCITLMVPPVSDRIARLVQVAETALYKGIEQVKEGNYLLDIAGAVDDYVRNNGYTVVEDFTGHGVGRNLHEEPSVFNNRSAITGKNPLPNVRLRAGMTLAIEPIINEGSNRVRILSDKWTAVTVDHKLSAQFEHTVLVTKDGYEIFTDRTKV